MINSFSPEPAKAPQEYNSVILAFEFVSDDQELAEVFSPLTTEDLYDLDRLNKVDFGFMLMYGLFLISVVFGLRKSLNQDWLKYLSIVIVLIVAADLLENLQLLHLTEAYRTGITNNQDVIDILAVSTWTKWVLLAITLACIGYALIIAHRYKWAGYALFLPLIFGTSAIALKTSMIEDTFGTSIFLCFFILWVLSLTYRDPSGSTTT